MTEQENNLFDQRHLTQGHGHGHGHGHRQFNKLLRCLSPAPASPSVPGQLRRPGTRPGMDSRESVRPALIVTGARSVLFTVHASVETEGCRARSVPALRLFG
jgi:hypothetical protein